MTYWLVGGTGVKVSASCSGARLPHPGIATDRTEDLVGFGFGPGRADPAGPSASRSP
jgi:hypothetical protein